MSTRYSTYIPASNEQTIEGNHRRLSEPFGRLNRSSVFADGVAVSKLRSSGLDIRRPLNDRQARVRFHRERVNSRVTARDLMTACAATLRAEDSIESAARLMSETHNRSIPVLDGAGHLIGIITDCDITVKLVAHGASIPHAQVSDCMTTEAFACSADCSLESCISAMSWHQLKSIPIVDDEHRLLGTIGQSDLACYICENAERVERGTMADILWALAY